MDNSNNNNNDDKVDHIHGKNLEGAPRRARQTLLYSWYKTGHICKKKV